MLVARAALLLSLLFAAACRVQPADPTPVRVVGEGGFLDVDVPIERVIEEADIVRIVARGHIEDGNVGLEVDFPLPRRRANGPIRLSIGRARISSLGEESDRLVKFLAQRYGMAGPAAGMLKDVEASAVGLDDDATGPWRGRKEMKFFFYEDGPDDRYAEVYVNVDFDGHMLEIHEKDPDYRKALILAFTTRP